jgi:hypothetical protein
MPNNDYILRSDALKAIRYENWREGNRVPSIEGLHLTEYQLLAEAINNIPAADVEPKRKWIPVTERLPVGGDDSGDICENVCLMLDDRTVSCGWMNGITKKVYFLNARDDFIIKAPITRVTHWMPLPSTEGLK